MELITVIKCRPHGCAAVRDPAHQLSVHVLHVCRVLLISELHPLCTVCTTIAPRVLHFSAVDYLWNCVEMWLLQYECLEQPSGQLGRSLSQTIYRCLKLYMTNY